VEEIQNTFPPSDRNLRGILKKVPLLVEVFLEKNLPPLSCPFFMPPCQCVFLALKKTSILSICAEEKKDSRDL
jgi:hypothetical protein